MIGQTYEGRDIVALSISSGGNGERPAVFIEAGIHAREWIAPSVALYLLNQLVENYEANKDLVDSLDWFIVPVTNPDGYEYTNTDVSANFKFCLVIAEFSKSNSKPIIALYGAFDLACFRPETFPSAPQ